jgi:hypothetical protein
VHFLKKLHVDESSRWNGNSLKVVIFILSIVFTFMFQGTAIASRWKKQQHVVVSVHSYKGMQINIDSCSGNTKTLV